MLGGLAVAGVATAAVGPPIGGLLVGAAGWRWAFLINIPVTAVALAMALRLSEGPSLDRADSGFRTIAHRIDLAGIAGFATSISRLPRAPVRAPTQGARQGADDRPWTWQRTRPTANTWMIGVKTAPLIGARALSPSGHPSTDGSTGPMPSRTTERPGRARSRKFC
ncbi:MFS transporter [Streptomyces sp. NPDC052164]|uniref:MFS transporter n=1 Tax=unclassified Streptomyces TaxID=2593676 RepID=UPI00343C93A4